jgi:hypothetical protein
MGRRNPMLANDYSQGYLGQGHASFAEFSTARNGMKQFAYQHLNESDLIPFRPALAVASQPSYQENVPMISDFNVNTTSLSTPYSGHSSTSSTADLVSLVTVNGANHQDALTKGVWWPEIIRSNHGQYQDTYGFGNLHDSFPKPQKQQHQHYSDLWIAGIGSSNDWITQATEPITISPKALTLNVPCAPFSTSGSSQGLLLSLSDSSSASTSGGDTPDSDPENLSEVEAPVPIRQHRQILSDSMPQSRVVPVLPGNSFTSRKTTQKQSSKTKSESRSRRRPSPSYHTKSFAASASSKKVDPVPPKSLAPKRIEPKLANPTSGSDSSQTSPSAQELHHRGTKDDFLVRSKLAGMSYKDIRRQGNFVEAESTLRGRFRTLTKSKAARVRKPEWTDNDVNLHFWSV